MTLKKNQHVYNFNILNDNVDDWDNLQSQVQEYTKKHEINGWENIIICQINLHASSPKINYRDPSLGLATKARGCKVASQVGNPGALHMLPGVQRV
jgi:hypothetical protein